MTPIEISIIIPSYNEEKRLPPYLKDWLNFLPKHFRNYEIIIVEDGSTDGLASIVRKMPEYGKQIRLIEKKHEGKGAAVQTGMIEAVGAYRLFADADGSTPVEELLRLFPQIKGKKESISIGSRVQLNGTTKITRNLIRHYRGRIFATLVTTLSGVDVYDSQCGFKLFTEEAVRRIFPNMKTPGWAFDVEILLRAKKMGIPINEVPINWHDEDGSKVRAIRDSLRMLFDVIQIRKLVK